MIVFFGAEFTKVYSDSLYGETPASENGVKDKKIKYEKKTKGK